MAFSPTQSSVGIAQITMKNRLIAFCCWMAGIAITVALLIVAVRFEWVGGFLIVASIVWAAFDCRRIRLWHYYTGISCRPATLTLLMVLAWFFVFPWYVGMRLKILTRTARLREEFQPHISSAPPVLTGLVQPWRYWPVTPQPRLSLVLAIGFPTLVVLIALVTEAIFVMASGWAFGESILGGRIRSDTIVLFACATLLSFALARKFAARSTAQWVAVAACATAFAILACRLSIVFTWSER